MKRSDDSRLIKIPDVSSANISVVGKPPTQQNSASIVPVFPQRPSIIEMPQQPVMASNAGGAATAVQHPIQAHRAGVTVFRGEPLSSSAPPAAHTGVVVTATPAQAVTIGQPPSVVSHGPAQSVPQPATNIKPETISKFK
jgi:hypothetical protein